MFYKNNKQKFEKNGLISCTAAETPFLTPKHKKDRIEFCNANLERNWSVVFFKDEKVLQSYKSGKARVIRKKGERFNSDNMIFKNKVAVR